jgi:hypothetical protein
MVGDRIKKLLSFLLVLIVLNSNVYAVFASENVKKCGVFDSKFVNEYQLETDKTKLSVNEMIALHPSLAMQGKAINDKIDEIISGLRREICYEGFYLGADIALKIRLDNNAQNELNKWKSVEYLVDILIQDADRLLATKKSDTSSKKSTSKKVVKKNSSKNDKISLNIEFTWKGAEKHWQCAEGQMNCIQVGYVGDNVPETIWLYERTCRNNNEYLDFSPGTRVVITNDKSQILNTASLRWSDTKMERKQMKYWDAWNNLEISKCYLVAKIQVPVSKFYGIKIGNENIYVISHEELKAESFNVVLSKG